MSAFSGFLVGHEFRGKLESGEPIAYWLTLTERPGSLNREEYIF